MQQCISASLLGYIPMDLFYSPVPNNNSGVSVDCAGGVPCFERKFIDSNNSHQPKSNSPIYPKTSLNNEQKNSNLASETFPGQLDEERAKRLRARKTAHSKIERRRRIKMNEQFDQLKHLIPACSKFSSATGNDFGLHKCVILEEAVKYIKYLEFEISRSNVPVTPSPTTCSPICFYQTKTVKDEFETVPRQTPDLQSLASCGNQNDQNVGPVIHDNKKTKYPESEPRLKIANLLS